MPTYEELVLQVEALQDENDELRAESAKYRDAEMAWEAIGRFKTENAELRARCCRYAEEAMHWKAKATLGSDVVMTVTPMREGEKRSAWEISKAFPRMLSPKLAP